jgi:3-hydroxyacyl-[acyl-carrier-protein] dehydratase
LIIEALAQCGAILGLYDLEDRETRLPLFSGINQARFRKPVVPGDTLMLEVTALRVGTRIQKMRGEAKVDGQIVADAEIMCVIATRDAAP